jgi:hypothetical protein
MSHTNVYIQCRKDTTEYVVTGIFDHPYMYFQEVVLTEEESSIAVTNAINTAKSYMNQFENETYTIIVCKTKEENDILQSLWDRLVDIEKTSHWYDGIELNWMILKMKVQSWWNVCVPVINNWIITIRKKIIDMF